MDHITPLITYTLSINQYNTILAAESGKEHTETSSYYNHLKLHILAY